MVQGGADINALDGDGTSILHRAVMSGDAELVSLLMNLVGEFLIECWFTYEPCVVNLDLVYCVLNLLHFDWQGADRQSKDLNGNIPYTIALKNDKATVSQLLQDTARVHQVSFDSLFSVLTLKLYLYPLLTTDVW